MGIEQLKANILFVLLFFSLNIFNLIITWKEKILSCKNNRIPHQQYVRAQNILANSKAKHTTEEQNMLLKRKAFLLPKSNSGYSIEDYSFQARTANLVKSHLRKKHIPDDLLDNTIEESLQSVRDYFATRFNTYQEPTNLTRDWKKVEKIFYTWIRY